MVLKKKKREKKRILRSKKGCGFTIYYRKSQPFC